LHVNIYIIYVQFLISRNLVGEQVNMNSMINARGIINIIKSKTQSCRKA